MIKTKIQSHPPKIQKHIVNEKLVNQFIESAEIPKFKNDFSTSNVFPWEANDIRNDIKKLFSLRLSEPYMLKLKYIQNKTGKSMHQFCLEKLLPEIDKAIADLLKSSKI